MAKRRSRRVGRTIKDYKRERINTDGKESITIWGFVKIAGRDAKHIGYANQEGKFSRTDNHAEARWVRLHVNKLQGFLKSNRTSVEQIEFDVTSDPCPNCRSGPLPAIRSACKAVLGEKDVTPIYVFVDVKKNFSFGHYLEVPVTGPVTGTPQPDV